MKTEFPQADANIAHAGQLRGRGTPQSGANSGDGRVAQRTPQTCRNRQVRQRSPLKRVKSRENPHKTADPAGRIAAMAIQGGGFRGMPRHMPRRRRQHQSDISMSRFTPPACLPAGRARPTNGQEAARFAITI